MSVRGSARTYTAHTVYQSPCLFLISVRRRRYAVSGHQHELPLHGRPGHGQDHGRPSRRAHVQAAKSDPLGRGGVVLTVGPDHRVSPAVSAIDGHRDRCRSYSLKTRFAPQLSTLRSILRASVSWARAGLSRPTIAVPVLDAASKHGRAPC